MPGRRHALAAGASESAAGMMLVTELNRLLDELVGLRDHVRSLQRLAIGKPRHPDVRPAARSEIGVEGHPPALRPRYEQTGNLDFATNLQFARATVRTAFEAGGTSATSLLADAGINLSFNMRSPTAAAWVQAPT